LVEQQPLELQLKRERRDSGLQGVSSAPTEVYDSADMAALMSADSDATVSASALNSADELLV